MVGYEGRVGLRGDEVNVWETSKEEKEEERKKIHLSSLVSDIHMFTCELKQKSIVPSSVSRMSTKHCMMLIIYL